MAPQVIAVIGSLMANMMMVTDRIPDGGETIMALEYIELLGGKGCNAAVAAYRTSHKRPTEIALPKLKRSDSFQDVRTSSNGDIEVRMIGAIGDDHLEKKFKKVLQEDHVDISGLVTVPNTRSSVCFVLIENATRENRILVTPNALSYWKPHHFLRAEDLGNGIRPDLVVAQLEICKEAVEQMIETAGQAGIDFLLNAAPATPINPRSYKYITHLIVNETEASILSGRSLDELCQETWPLVTQEFLDRGVKNVVLTLGEKGAYYANSDGHGHIPGFEVEVLDTTGAGDTFTGTYASDYLQQKAGGSWDIKSAILRANKAAALAVSTFGAQEGIPWLDQIEAFEARTRY